MTTIITVKLAPNATYGEFEALIDTLKRQQYIDEFTVTHKPKTEVFVAPKPAFDPKAPTINEALSAAVNESMDALFDHLGIDPKTAQSYVDPDASARAALERLTRVFEARVNALTPYGPMVQQCSADPILVAEAQTAADAVRRELTALPPLQPAGEATEGKHAA